MNFKRQELNRQSFCKCTLRFHEIFFRIFRSLFWIFWRKLQLERKASCSLQSANFSVLISKLTNQRRFDESRDVENEIYWVKNASNMRQTENLRTVVLSNLLYLGLAQLHLHSLVKTGRKITKYKNFRNPWCKYLRWKLKLLSRKNSTAMSGKISLHFCVIFVSVHFCITIKCMFSSVSKNWTICYRNVIV